MSLVRAEEDVVAVAASVSPDEESLRKACERLLRYQHGAWSLAGLWCSTQDPNVQRLAPLLLRDNDDWMVWAIFLLPPAPKDITTALNILSGIATEGRWTSDAFQSLPVLAMVSRFLQSMLRSAPILAERAIDVMATIPPSVVAAMPETESLINLARDCVGKVDDHVVKEELESCVQDLHDARGTSPVAVVGLSHARLRAEVSESIESTPSASRACDGLRRLDAFLLGSSRVSKTAHYSPPLIQRLRFQSVRGADPDDFQVADGFKAWCNFSKWWLSDANIDDAHLRPAGASAGSFQLDLVLEQDGEQAQRLIDAANSVAKRIERGECLTDDQSWRGFLATLTESSLAVSIQHLWGREASNEINLTRAVIRSAQRVAVPSSKVDSQDVPQANLIERVFELVEKIQDPIEFDEMSMDRRDRNYYKRAAKILGLLAEDGEVLPAGRQIVRLSPEERLRTAVVLFETSRVGEAWIAFCNGKTLKDVQVDSAEQFLRERSLLSGDTVTRRAKTLRAWYCDLVKFDH